MSKESTAWACCRFCPSERMSVLRRTSTSPSSGVKSASPVTDLGQNRSSSLARASGLVSDPMTTVQVRSPSRPGVALDTLLQVGRRVLECREYGHLVRWRMRHDFPERVQLRVRASLQVLQLDGHTRQRLPVFLEVHKELVFEQVGGHSALGGRQHFFDEVAADERVVREPCPDEVPDHLSRKHRPMLLNEAQQHVVRIPHPSHRPQGRVPGRLEPFEQLRLQQARQRLFRRRLLWLVHAIERRAVAGHRECVYAHLHRLNDARMGAVQIVAALVQLRFRELHRRSIIESFVRVSLRDERAVAADRQRVDEGEQLRLREARRIGRTGLGEEPPQAGDAERRFRKGAVMPAEQQEQAVQVPQ